MKSDPIDYLDKETHKTIAGMDDASLAEAAAKVSLEEVQNGSLISEMAHT